jgi:molecular chaperone GrpE
MKKPHEVPGDEEIVLDVDSGVEIAPEDTEIAAASLKGKLKQLRDELALAKKERDENLAGWQRAKADLINFRRNMEEDKVRDAARAQGKIVRAILPALDSFASAMKAPTWHHVDPEWREGVERIAAQLTGSLERDGVRAFGAVGDGFDPTLHESMSVAPTDDEAQDHTLAEVLQLGYKIDDEVIRPAKVVVAQYSGPPPAS